jgi:cytochrome c oxidase cbb3-type subunit IV
VSLNTIRAVVTVTLFVLFVLLWISAWSKGRRAEYTAAALIPLQDDTDACDSGPQEIG